MSDNLTPRQQRRVRAIGREFQRNMEKTGLGVSVSVNGGEFVRITKPKPERDSMAKVHATIDKETGEVRENGELIAGDIRDLERAIANAYVELQQLAEAKKDATDAHKEGQERLNQLVGDLTRRVNGEQPLPWPR